MSTEKHIERWVELKEKALAGQAKTEGFAIVVIDQGGEFFHGFNLTSKAVALRVAAELKRMAAECEKTAKALKFA